MRPAVLIDTGPIVAVLNRNDREHASCVSTLATVQAPLLTTWPVITEAAYLIRSSPRLVSRLLSSFGQGLFQLATLDEADLVAMANIFGQYPDQGFQIADLSLMHLASRENISVVFTLDHRDFSVYRLPTGRTLDIIPTH